MQRLELRKKDKKGITYSRKTAENALEDVINRIKEANDKNEFIYKITKAVLFGSFLNSDKNKIGDLDIAIYIELKDKTISEIEQNLERARYMQREIPFLLRFIYGKEEIFKFIRNKKRILELHDGVKVDEDAKKCNYPKSYIYFDKNEIIFEE